MAKNGFDYDKIRRALNDRARLFKGSVVKVGIPSGKRYPSGRSIAAVAVIHEFGAPEKNIPQRSFLRSTRNAKQAEWARLLADGAKAVAERRISLTGMLDGVGAVAAADVVQTIASRIPPPLKPATVEARVRRARRASRKRKYGATSLPVTLSTPLEDTGALVAHISYGTGPEGEEFTNGKAIRGGG